MRQPANAGRRRFLAISEPERSSGQRCAVCLGRQTGYMPPGVLLSAPHNVAQRIVRRKRPPLVDDAQQHRVVLRGIVGNISVDIQAVELL